MATKTKEAGNLDNSPAIQETLCQVGLAQRQVEEGFKLAGKVALALHEAEATLSRVASRLRRLLEAPKRGRASQKRAGSKPAKRSNVDGGMPKGSPIHSRQPNARDGKRLPRKPSGKESTALTIWRIDNDDL